MYITYFIIQFNSRARVQNSKNFVLALARIQE